jgi:SAM-dependent methyltransferase
MSAERTSVASTAAIWHDVECGAYDADLALWEELAAAAGGPILELGCGTGRVSLHLARRGHEVIGLDRDLELIASLRGRSDGLAVDAMVAAARDFQLDREVGLVLAPMQVLQLLASAEDRCCCLAAAAAALRPGGRLAAAIVERLPEADPTPSPVPDLREVEGWVYSSLPLAVAHDGPEIVIRRLRQTVSPAGRLSEEQNEVRIQVLSGERLEAEASAAGLDPVARHEVPPTDLHVGSLVVVLAREA